MISAPCSKVHLRLVKKLPGQPPSGAIVPWGAPGLWANVIKQPPPPAAVSRQRPAISMGGGCGGGGGGGAAVTSGGASAWLAQPAAAATASATIAAMVIRPASAETSLNPDMAGSNI